ncbi:hypothetical protein T484DRAFT_1921646, partial [Baffinella frigidus]
MITREQAGSVFEQIEQSAVWSHDNWERWQRAQTPGEEEEAKAKEEEEAAKEAAEAGSALPAEKGGGCKVAILTGVEQDAPPAGTASAKEGGA